MNSGTLLGPDEPPAYEVVRPEGSSPFFLTCDHASRRIPDRLGDLGLAAAEHARHIAWDVGAAGLARTLSEHLDAALVLQNYSRLVIDANRPFENPDSIPIRSEATEIPGNRGLAASAVAARRREIFAPYHERIGQLLEHRAAAGRATVVIAVHSFTPVYHGVQRLWHLAVLYGRDPRFARHLLAVLGRESGLCVGDNEPYQVDDESDYGIPVHAEKRGLPNALVEVRQDEIGTDDQQQRWGERLATWLGAALRASGAG